MKDLTRDELQVLGAFMRIADKKMKETKDELHNYMLDNRLFLGKGYVDTDHALSEIYDTIEENKNLEKYTKLIDVINS